MKQYLVRSFTTTVYFDTLEKAQDDARREAKKLVTSAESSATVEVYEAVLVSTVRAESTVSISEKRCDEDQSSP
jgi:hypothetical protein